MVGGITASTVLCYAEIHAVEVVGHPDVIACCLRDHGIRHRSPIAVGTTAVFFQLLSRKVAVVPHAGHLGTLQNRERWGVDVPVSARQRQTQHVDGRTGRPIQKVTTEGVRALAAAGRAGAVKTFVVLAGQACCRCFCGCIVVGVATFCVVIT